MVLTLPTGANATLADGTGVVTIVDNDGALTASSAPAGTRVEEALDPAVARRLLDLAVRQWIAAGAPPDRLAGIRLVVADLPGLQLADASGSTITVDVDAAGWGWAVAPGAGDPHRLHLLSVLLHEIGHLLGHEHADAGVMRPELAAGAVLTVDRLGAPATGQVAAATASRTRGALDATRTRFRGLSAISPQPPVAGRGPSPATPRAVCRPGVGPRVHRPPGHGRRHGVLRSSRPPWRRRRR